MRRSLRTQVQRLDRNTSGAMMVCRTSKAAARISEQLRERHVEKVYLAGT
jgi:23S rRNA pseudouridine1911/1915/1917 synthase